MNIKSTLLACSAILLTYNSQAQDFLGYRSDNYNGVNGVIFNPANVVDSRYKLDVGILGINVMAGNSNININFANLSEALADSNFSSKLIGKGVKSSGIASIAAHTPSVMFDITPTTSVALITRSRLLFNINDFDGDVIHSLENELSQNPPYTINSSSNMRMNINVWSEIGVSAGHVLMNRDGHFLKGGITLKYLMGVGNGYIQIKDLQTTVDADTVGGKSRVYMTDASGTVVIGSGGMALENGDNTIKYNGNGFGMDLGFVYEYRPDNGTQNNGSNYKFKFSAAVLDIGSIRYNRIKENSAAYDAHIAAGQKFYLDVFDGGSLSDFKTTLDLNPAYFTKTSDLNESTYKVNLPTTIQLAADYMAYKNLYVGISSQISTISNKSKVYNSQYINSTTITGRYETKNFAAYLPINYNDLTYTNIGLGLRAGPVYLGSSSLINSVFGSSKQVDFYIGAHIGIKKKPGKRTMSRDRDGDGVEDVMDRCPDVKGLAMYDGCPEPDKEEKNDSKEAE